MIGRRWLTARLVFLGTLVTKWAARLSRNQGQARGQANTRDIRFQEFREESDRKTTCDSVDSELDVERHIIWVTT